jgi:hypothetical protein
MAAQGFPAIGHTRCIEQLPVTFVPNLGTLGPKTDSDFVLEKNHPL